MKRHSFKIAVALTTFAIGVLATTVWYLRSGETPQLPPSEAEQTASANGPESVASYDPCAFPRPVGRKLEVVEAVRLAECFIIENGYTDLPPMEDRSKLTPENLYPGTDDDGLKRRHDSLERRAYGFGQGGDGSWTVVFRYRRTPEKVRFYGDKLEKIGRAVVMDTYGSHMRVRHVDIPLGAYTKLEN